MMLGAARRDHYNEAAFLGRQCQDNVTMLMRCHVDGVHSPINGLPINGGDIWHDALAAQWIILVHNSLCIVWYVWYPHPLM